MRILFTDGIGVRGYLGGSHISLLEMMSGLVAKGYDVSLACPYEDLLTAEARKRSVAVTLFGMRRPINTRMEWRGIAMFNWFAAVANILIYLGAGITLMRAVREVRPDILHSNDMFLSISAGLAARMTGTPCVWHVRTIPSHRVPRLAVKAYGMLAYLLADRIVANSEATAGFLRATVARPKVEVVYNGVDLREFLPVGDAEPIRRQLKIGDDVVAFAIFGRVIPLKGHHVLVTAMSRLKRDSKTILLVVGHFDPASPYVAALRDSIRQLDLGDRVRFIGFQMDIRPYLQAAEVVVSASVQAESFGRTLVEGMAAGKPLVATNIGAHNEIIEDGVTGLLVSPDSAEQMAAVLSVLAASASQRATFGAAGRARALERFSIEVFIDRLARLYDPLVGKRPSAAAVL